MWNIFANPDCPLPQSTLRRLLAPRNSGSEDQLLSRTLALFKTPGLRGLALSDPYLHTGRLRTLEEVIEFYRKFSELARRGEARNPAPELLGIRLAPEDVAPLTAFLRSLNEDYE